MNTIEIAKSWHRMIALHIDFLLEGIDATGHDVVALKDETQCELGNWIIANRDRYCALPAYEQLVKDHGHFHRVVERALKEHTAGTKPLLTKLKKTALHDASAALCATLDTLAGAMVAAPGDHKQVGLDERQCVRLGLRLLDDQHMVLSGLLGRLNDQPDAPATSASFVRDLSAVARMMAMHFETEEMFMRQIEYPAHLTIAHIQEHERLLGHLMSVCLDLMGGKDTVASVLYVELNDATLDHIAEFDSQLNDYITNQA